MQHLFRVELVMESALPLFPLCTTLLQCEQTMRSTEFPVLPVDEYNLSKTKVQFVFEKHGSDQETVSVFENLLPFYESSYQ